MVDMGVRGDTRLQRQPASFEIADQKLAESLVRAEAVRGPAVDQPRPAAGKDDQDRFSLPHAEHPHLKM
jgi:hypothetical protein